MPAARRATPPLLRAGPRAGGGRRGGPGARLCGGFCLGGGRWAPLRRLLPGRRAAGAVAGGVAALGMLAGLLLVLRRPRWDSDDEGDDLVCPPPFYIAADQADWLNSNPEADKPEILGEPRIGEPMLGLPCQAPPAT